jgi:hypothetical protein
MFVPNHNKMAKQTETIKIGGRDIPVTKSGLPNMVYLSKEEREVVESYKVSLKKEKKELRITELKQALNSLKK